MSSGRYFHGLFGKKPEGGLPEEKEALGRIQRQRLSRRVSWRVSHGLVADSPDVDVEVQRYLGQGATWMTLLEMDGVSLELIPEEYDRVPPEQARIRAVLYKQETNRLYDEEGPPQAVLVAVDRHQLGSLAGVQAVQFHTRICGKPAELQRLDEAGLFVVAKNQVEGYLRTLPQGVGKHQIQILLVSEDLPEEFMIMLAACCLYRQGTFVMEDPDKAGYFIDRALSRFPDAETFRRYNNLVSQNELDRAENVTDAALDATSSALTVKSIIGEVVGIEGLVANLDKQNEMARTVTVNAATVLPVISQFLRGLLSFREAWKAWRDKEDPDRHVKVWTALTCGVVSLGSGIVSTLYLGHVGLLATAAALTLTPIVLASVGIGVYLIVLLRDMRLRNALLARIKEKERQRDANPENCQLSVELTYLKESHTEAKVKARQDAVLLVGVGLSLAALVAGAVVTGGVLPLVLAIVGGSLVASMVLVRLGGKLYDMMHDSAVRLADINNRLEEKERQRQRHPRRSRLAAECDELRKARSAARVSIGRQVILTLGITLVLAGMVAGMVATGGVLSLILLAAGCVLAGGAIASRSKMLQAGHEVSPRVSSSRPDGSSPEAEGGRYTSSLAPVLNSIARKDSVLSPQVTPAGPEEAGVTPPAAAPSSGSPESHPLSSSSPRHRRGR